MIKDPFTKENRGFGFVKFSNSDDAMKAIEGTNKTEFFDKTISVEVAQRREPRRKTPGRYLGKFRNRRRSPYSRGGRSRSREDRRYHHKRHYRHRDSHRDRDRDRDRYYNNRRSRSGSYHRRDRNRRSRSHSRSRKHYRH